MVWVFLCANTDHDLCFIFPIIRFTPKDEVCHLFPFCSWCGDFPVHSKRLPVAPFTNRYYVTFTKITRPRIKIEAPDLPRGELNRELGRRWRELSDEAKRKWVPSLLEENNGSGGNAGGAAAVEASSSLSSSSSSLLGASAAELHLGESDKDDDDEGDDDDGNLPGDLALPASMVETSVVEM